MPLSPTDSRHLVPFPQASPGVHLALILALILIAVCCRSGLWRSAAEPTFCFQPMTYHPLGIGVESNAMKYGKVVRAILPQLPTRPTGFSDIGVGFLCSWKGIHEQRTICD